MKTNFLILLGAFNFFTFTTNSQITITQSDVPSVGQSNLVNTSMDLQIDYASTGADHVWDFSDLTPLSQSVRSYSNVSSAGLIVGFVFGSFAGNYAASYYGKAIDFDLSAVSALLPIQIDNINQFYKKSASSLSSIGYSVEVQGQNIPFKSDTIERKYSFPLTYGDSYSSRGYTLVNTEPLFEAILIQYRQRSSEVDGFGSIRTPYQSFNAIRVKHRIEEQDSVNFNATWLGINQPIRYEYEWLANGQVEPVLKISTIEVAGQEVVSSVEYLTDQPFLGLESLESFIHFYPNPVTDVLTVNSDVQLDVLEIVDLNGKIVYSQNSVNSGTNISLNHLVSGVYQVVGYKDGLKRVERLIKQ